MRILSSLLPLLLCGSVTAQSAEPEHGVVLNYSRSLTAPLNALQLHDAATEAWTWTFGREPGARIVATDRSAGTIKATARINFRSAMLTGREETTGTINYNVLIQTQAGTCRISVTDVTHTGNRNTARGGIHLGQLMRDDAQAGKAGGMGRTNIVRVHRELREMADTRIQSLLRSFEARIRANVDP